MPGSRHTRRRHAISAVDQPASLVEQVFAVLTIATMLVTSAYLVLM